jgi:hypothetical protein
VSNLIDSVAATILITVGYTVFSIPVGVVYRPNSAKVKNLKTKDYLGKARLVAASDKPNTFTGFAGSEAKKNMFRDDLTRDDRLPDSISFAATNLVKPGLQSRGRQQSEPPINRNMFPPTPPPEEGKPASFAGSNTSGIGVPGMTGRAASVRSRGSRPENWISRSLGWRRRDRGWVRCGQLQNHEARQGIF